MGFAGLMIGLILILIFGTSYCLACKKAGVWSPITGQALKTLLFSGFTIFSVFVFRDMMHGKYHPIWHKLSLLCLSGVILLSFFVRPLSINPKFQKYTFGLLTLPFCLWVGYWGTLVFADLIKSFHEK